MSLIQRIQRLEWDRPADDLTDGGAGLLATVAGMTDEELDSLIGNLLAAMPRPNDAALAAVVDRAIAGGVEALAAEEFDRLHEWIVTA